MNWKSSLEKMQILFNESQHFTEEIKKISELILERFQSLPGSSSKTMLIEEELETINSSRGLEFEIQHYQEKVIEMINIIYKDRSTVFRQSIYYDSFYKLSGDLFSSLKDMIEKIQKLKKLLLKIWKLAKQAQVA